MVEAVKNEFIPGGYSDAPVAQLHVDIPGLRPERHEPDGRIVSPGNLATLVQTAKRIFLEKPWYRPLIRDIRQGNKSAVFITTLGGITIFVAAAAGFEFGVRHGKDLQHLPRILKRK